MNSLRKKSFDLEAMNVAEINPLEQQEINGGGLSLDLESSGSVGLSISVGILGLIAQIGLSLGLNLGVEAEV